MLRSIHIFVHLKTFSCTKNFKQTLLKDLEEYFVVCYIPYLVLLFISLLVLFRNLLQNFCLFILLCFHYSLGFEIVDKILQCFSAFEMFTTFSKFSYSNFTKNYFKIKNFFPIKIFSAKSVQNCVKIIPVLW